MKNCVNAARSYKTVRLDYAPMMYMCTRLTDSQAPIKIIRGLKIVFTYEFKVTIYYVEKFISDFTFKNSFFHAYAWTFGFQKVRSAAGQIFISKQHLQDEKVCILRGKNELHLK